MKPWMHLNWNALENSIFETEIQYLKFNICGSLYKNTACLSFKLMTEKG